MMRTEFSIPIRPYLKKWLLRTEFYGLQAPFKIEEDSLLGKYFMAIVQDNRSRVTDVRGDKSLEMTETLDVVLSEALAKRSPTTVKLMSINFYLDKAFKHDLITWINSQASVDVRPFVSSKSFLRDHKIDESEYTHDAAYRAYQRWKKQGYQRPNLRASVSTSLHRHSA